MEIKSKSISYLLAFVLLLVVGCDKFNGKMVTEVRPIGTVETLVLYDNVDVILTASADTFITVSASEYLIKNIVTTLENNTLTITNRNKANWTHNLHPEMTVWVPVKNIRQIEFYAQSQLTTESPISATDFAMIVGQHSYKSNGVISLEINVQQAEITQNNGYSDIAISGSTQQLTLCQSAFGPMDLSNLAAERATVLHRGSNLCRIRAHQSLTGSIEHVGDLYYYGNPEQLNVVENASGRLMKGD